MHSQHATPGSVASPEVGAPVLRGLGLVVAHAAWAGIAAPSLALYAAAVPALFAQSGGYTTVLLAGFGLGCFAVAGVIAYRRSDDPVALFASGFLALMGAANHPNVQALAAAYPDRAPVLQFAWWALWAALILFVFLFPDGRFAPRWMKAPVVLLVAGVFVAIFFGGGSLAEPPGALGLIVVAALVAGVAVQIHRYRRVSSAEGRQQTKWVVAGITIAVAAQALGTLAEPLFVRSGVPAALYDAADTTVITLAYFLIPLSIGVAVARYRLWDIDPIVNRALVYGTLTACVVGLYVLVVGGLGTALQAQGNLLLSILAAGLVAVLFQPLRERLQRLVNYTMYGERDEPYAVISRLGRRLEGTLPPDAVLPAIVEDVARALRLPHAAIWLADGDALRLGAAHGAGPSENLATDAEAVDKMRDSPDGLSPADLGPSSEYGAVLSACGVGLVLPLTHRGELVGALGLAPRGAGEGFSSADRALLRDLASQSGAAAHAVRLTAALRASLEDLERSRERLVVAQEEERRRIQRDLHDGLGPVLASMKLRLEACLDEAQEVRTPPIGELERLYELVGEATADIRRLVYDLRPPVLDQLGLIPALRQHCERFGRETGIEVRFEARKDLRVPAAAEVALLRVAQEALLNAGKHAGASRVEVRLERSDGLLALKVRDDGAGLPANGRAGGGTGIGSMRERAELLGGALRLISRPGGGTEVAVRIPVGFEGVRESW